MLLMVIFLGLAWCVVLLEQEARAPKWGPWGILVLAGLAGAVVGLGGLTRYSFGWLIMPVLVFVILFGGRRRVMLALIALAAFAAVMAPWVVRNYNVSGKPFGTATYAVLETTSSTPSTAWNARWSRTSAASTWWPSGSSSTPTCAKSSPANCPGWAAVGSRRSSWSGCWSGFATPPSPGCATSCMGCVLVLALAQALGRTQLSEESPEINSENLLVLLAPLVLVYGVSLFYLLLEQMPLPFPELRYVVIGIFSVVACLPMVFVFLPPKDHSRRLSALLPARPSRPWRAG